LSTAAAHFLNDAAQVWTDASVVSKLTSANYQVIASPSNYWYLNIATNTWQVIYSYNPTSGLSTQAQKDLVIGGEVALWGEFVDDNNIIGYVELRRCMCL
jgi:hexosaminidase